jgi:MFS family permease
VLVVAVVVVRVGRIGDMFGRVRMYNLGFAWFTLLAIPLSLAWSHGPAGALELIVLRMLQAIGGALLMANSAAIITDAFPAEQLGLALGTNMVAMIVGSFLGIIAGGLLSEVSWRWVFLVNVPIGTFATVWAYFKLKEIGIRIPAKIDWLGNVSFAAGLAMILVGITYSLEPYKHALTGWGSPFVLSMISGGVMLLVVFLLVEAKVRLRAREVRSWAALHDDARFRESLERAGIAVPYLPYAFGIRIYPDARDAARAVGVGVLSIRGEDVAPAREVAG